MLTKRILILICCMLGISAVGCRQTSDEASPSASAQRARGALDRVTVGSPERKTLKLFTEQPGRIEAHEETPTFSKLAGYVEEVKVDIGDQVEKGQVLIALWLPEYENELEQKLGLLAQAEAEVEQAKAALQAVEAAANSAQSMVALAQAAIGRAEGDYARWDSERERMQQLVSTGSVTPKLADETLNQFRAAESAKQEALASVTSAEARFEEAQANITKAQADVNAAQARVRVAESNVAQVETMLEYRQLRAPFDGVITRRSVDTRHYVHPANANNSEPLLVVASTDRVRVFVDIPEAEAAWLDAGYDDAAAGDPATVRIKSSGNQTIEGFVTRSSWALDSANRSLTAEIDLPNHDRRLLPGAYANVTILLEEREDVQTLPIAAVVRTADSVYCCVVVDSQIEHRPLELGLRVGEEVEVTQGLDGSEAVVLARASSLQEGQKVEVIGAP